MKLRALAYGGHPTPETVTVEMSIEEAVAIASVAGNVIGPGQATSSPVYDTLVSMINQHWEGGVDEAERALGVERWLFRTGKRDYVP